MTLLETVFDPYNYPFWILIIAVLAGAIAVISRPFSTYAKFVYPNAKFEAIGNPYLTEKELNKLVESKNLDGFIDLLNTNKDYTIDGKNTLEIQKSLDDNFIQTVQTMKKDSSNKMKDFYETYLEKFDIYLIKNVFKDKIQNKEINKNILDKAVLDSTKKLLLKIIEVEKSKMPQLLKENGFPENIIDMLSEEKIDFLKFDTEIDKFVIDKFKQIQLPYKCENGKKKFINYLIDTLNIKNILRSKQIGYGEDTCKKLFLGEGQEIATWKYTELSENESVSQVISSLQGTSYYDALKNAIEDYNKEGSVQVLENALDVNFIKLVKDVSIENYVTIGPTLRFIVSKEFEIRNLKVIVKGISENLSSEVIKKLLILEASG